MAEAEALRLVDAQVGLAHGAHFARQSDLAKDDGLGSQQTIRKARGHRDADAEVRRRLVDADAARHLDVDVAGADRQVDALLEHGQEQLDALDVDGVGRAARRHVRRRRDERLQLDEQRPRALDGRDDDRARVLLAVRQEELRGVGHVDEADVAHLEEAELIRAAKAVLDGAQDAVLGVALALEVEHGVDDVFEDARAGQRAVLRHMADDEGGDAVRLGDAQEVDGALAHLRDAARRALHVWLEDGLDGVDDEEFRLDVLHMRLDRFKVRLADDEQVVGKRLQAVGAHADLPRALLARHVEYLLALPRDVGADAQRQARLADARVADNQDHRAGDDAAAQDAVELA